MKHVLSNGMTLLASPSKLAPVVAVQGWIRFGAADETDDIAGVAHLFEHLLFKGTTTRPVGQIAREVEGLGGDLNAYTSYDQTVMHMTLGSAHLEKGVEILADALKNSIVDQDELDRERPVILEEIKRYNDMPGSVAGELLRKHLFGSHTYARPVIGFEKVVAEISREKIIELYHRHYNRKNVFLVVAGDFEESALLDICERHFRDLRDGQSTSARPLVRHTSSPGLYVQKHNSPDAILQVAWKAPNLIDPAAPALDALSIILGQGESSRLNQKLVLEKQLVRDIGASCWTPKDEGSFSVGFRGPAGTGRNLQKIIDEIRRTCEKPIRQDELEKAKKNLLSSATYSKETVDGLASRFGQYECLANDWTLDQKYFDDVRSLTTRDLEREKEKILDWSQAVVGGIVPTGDSLPKLSGKLVAKTQSSLPVETPIPNVERWEQCGLTVVLKQVPHLPIFSIRWVGLGGTRLENSKTQGIGSLWSRTVSSGSISPLGKVYTRDEINEMIDQCSAGFSAFFGRNSYGYQVDGLTDDFERLLELAASAHHHPTFDAKIVSHEKELQRTDIKTLSDRPGHIVSQIFSVGLFGKHPYALPGLGTDKSVRTFGPTQLRRLHNALKGQKQVLSVVGDISRERLQAALTHVLSGNEVRVKSNKPPKKIAIPKLKKSFAGRNFVDKEQTHILIGYPTVSFQHKDKWAFAGLSSLLSGQGGRLFLELRDKLSLCYTVAPTHIEGYDGGYFGFYIATSPEKEGIAVEALQKEIDRLRTEKIPVEEFDRAKSFAIGNYDIDQQRLSNQCLGMALDEVYGEGAESYFAYTEELSKVQISDLERVIKTYLAKNKPFVTAVVGPKLKTTAAKTKPSRKKG